jgi:hypothetical protein
MRSSLSSKGEVLSLPIEDGRPSETENPLSPEGVILSEVTEGNVVEEPALNEAEWDLISFPCHNFVKEKWAIEDDGKS